MLPPATCDFEDLLGQNGAHTTFLLFNVISYIDITFNQKLQQQQDKLLIRLG